MADLLPASWRGVPFGVIATGAEAGRRWAVHEYPGKDGQSLEDMGRRGNRYRIRGFICTDGLYGGGSLALQRQLLKAAAEAAGTGILVHPAFGILTVGCESLSISDDLDAGTRASVEFSFQEHTLQSILGVSTSTLSAVLGAAASLVGVAEQAFALAGAGGTSAALASGQWSATIVSAGQDATALTNLASQLPGNFGRYYAGGNTGFLSSNYVGDTTVDQLVADSATARAAIGSAAAAVATDFAALSTASAAQAATDVQALVASLSAACADPADTLRLQEALYGSTSTGVTAVDDLYRRCALAAAAQASTGYQPTSQDDATGVQAALTALIDAESELAGDEGEDDVYQALRSLRVAVIADLQARGGAVAALKTVTRPLPLPALTLAQQLYADASRADELITEADPVHPLFMPTSFQALAA